MFRPRATSRPGLGWEWLFRIIMVLSAVIPLVMAMINRPNVNFQVPSVTVLGLAFSAGLLCARNAGHGWWKAIGLGMISPAVWTATAFAHYWAMQYLGLNRVGATVRLIMVAAALGAVATVAWRTRHLWWGRLSRALSGVSRAVAWYRSRPGWQWRAVRLMAIPFVVFFVGSALGHADLGFVGALVALAFAGQRAQAPVVAPPPPVPANANAALPFMGGPAPMPPGVATPVVTPQPPAAPAVAPSSTLPLTGGKKQRWPKGGKRP